MTQKAQTSAIAGPEKVRCNICGGENFLAGPGGRMSTMGLPPRCARCQSLERHRVLRDFYDRFRCA